MEMIHKVLEQLGAGAPALVCGPEGATAAQIVVAAELIQAEVMASVVRHSSGFVRVALPSADLIRLGLPLLVSSTIGLSPDAVSVDALEGVSTGISATDRARTARLLAEAGTLPRELSRPGHVVPVRSADGGVLVRPARLEAAVDLVRMTGLRPAAVVADLVDDTGELPSEAALGVLSGELGWPVITVEEVVSHRRRSEQAVDLAGVLSVTAAGASIRPVVVQGTGSSSHLAMVVGDAPLPGDEVFVHRECLAGVLGDSRCGCRAALLSDLATLAELTRGVVITLRLEAGEPTPVHSDVLPLRHQDLEAAEAVMERLGMVARRSS